MAEVSFAEDTATGELPVASTYLDTSNCTLITTRRIFTTKDGSKYSVSFQHIKTYDFGAFKGRGDNPVIDGNVTTVNGRDFPVLIESGKPSMVVINAVRTILNLTQHDS